jgi:hypothetical protein
MRIFLIIGICLTTIGLNAQKLLLMGADSSFRSAAVMITMEGEGEIRSNTIQNAFLDKLVFGGHIDRGLIDAQEKHMNDVNMLGGNFRGNLTMRLMSDSLFRNPNWSWQVTMGSRTLLETTFSKDLFHLAFRGNADFLDEYAFLSSTGLLLTNYQKLGGGIFHKESLSGFTVSVVNGQSFNAFDLELGRLFTSAEGDSLSFNYLTSSTRSDTSVSGLGSGPGIGMAFDGVLNFKQGEDGYIQLALHDFGFVSWNNATLVGNNEGTMNWTGLELTDILNDDSTLPSFNDSLTINEKQGSTKRWLPGSFDARIMRKVGQSAFYEIGFAIRPVIAYNPMLFAGYHHNFNEKTLVGATGTYGGYGRLRFGLSVEHLFGKSVYLAIGTSDVYGAASGKGYGRDAYLKVNYSIFRK